MTETSKSRLLWTPDSLEHKVLQGKGIDIGPANDPVIPGVKEFDMEDGDANIITHYVHEQFDYVYSSHCLEHMHDPYQALEEWWKLVKIGGYIFFAIPDEDLYEQGVFPSRFNPDHKATFTISKSQSWSSKSVNVFDLARSLAGGQIVKIALQDNNYDRRLYRYGPRRTPNFFMKFFVKGYRRFIYKGVRNRLLESIYLTYEAVDQTRKDNTLAQIICIVQKIT